MIQTTALNGMFILFSAIVCWSVWAGTRAYYLQERNRIIRAHNARVRILEAQLFEAERLIGPEIDQVRMGK